MDFLMYNAFEKGNYISEGGILRQSNVYIETMKYIAAYLAEEHKNNGR